MPSQVPPWRTQSPARVVREPSTRVRAANGPTYLVHSAARGQAVDAVDRGRPAPPRQAHLGRQVRLIGSGAAAATTARSATGSREISSTSTREDEICAVPWICTTTRQAERYVQPTDLPTRTSLQSKVIWEQGRVAALSHTHAVKSPLHGYNDEKATVLFVMALIRFLYAAIINKHDWVSTEFMSRWPCGLLGHSVQSKQPIALLTAQLTTNQVFLYKYIQFIYNDNERKMKKNTRTSITQIANKVSMPFICKNVWCVSQGSVETLLRWGENVYITLR